MFSSAELKEGGERRGSLQKGGGVEKDGGHGKEKKNRDREMHDPGKKRQSLRAERGKTETTRIPGEKER